MNTLQSALVKAFPKEIERIAKEERAAKFDRAAANGKKLLERAAKAVEAGKPEEALTLVRQDRYACACALAKEEKKPVKWAFGELERMEKLLNLSVSGQGGKSPTDTAPTQACKEVVAKEWQALLTPVS